MKFPSFFFLILFLFACKDDPLSKYKIPDSIIKANLAEKYNRAKWEIYKENKDFIIKDEALNQKISYLRCDLGDDLRSYDTATVSMNDGDFMTIFLDPSHKGNFTDVLRMGYNNMVYGVAFNGDSMKYLSVGDKSYQVFNDSISKAKDSIFIKYIQEHRQEINPWIVDYAISKEYIK
jgi:hypothetical protein